MWPSKWDVFIEPDGILWEPDPFSGSRRVLPVRQLAEVCVGWWPAAVRSISGEYHFVPAPSMRQLADLADGHGVPFVHRADLWSWILEPFLDTEFSAELRLRTTELLEASGVSATQVDALRARVGEGMMAMTAVSWEWSYYGLFDVLCAMRSHADGRFAAFKAEAFAIADRGAVRPGSKDDFLAFAHADDEPASSGA